MSAERIWRILDRVTDCRVRWICDRHDAAIRNETVTFDTPEEVIAWLAEVCKPGVEVPE